jgi:hypothetical protein
MWEKALSKHRESSWETQLSEEVSIRQDPIGRKCRTPRLSLRLGLSHRVATATSK